MVEKTERSGGKSGPRSADGRRFEVFLREEESDPVRHVGTVAAPTPDAAHEEASKLFGWYARDVWICPASELYRYSAESLAANGDDDAEEPDEANANANDAEPRVYEETEGTPTVSSEGTPTVACGRAPMDDGTEDGEPTEDGGDER